MNGNIFGERFPKFVRDQIEIRQILAGAGFLEGGQNPRTPEVINYLNTRNAWIKMASPVSVLEGSNANNETIIEKKLRKVLKLNPDNYRGKILARKAVLFNTIQEQEIGKDDETKGYKPRSGVYNNIGSIFATQNHIYGIGGPRLGPSPPPGIISVKKTVKDKGSIEVCNVEIKANNKFQFELIELLYLRLGFFMIVEWGWDKYAYKDENDVIQFADTGATAIDKYWFNENQVTGDLFQYIKQLRRDYHCNYEGFIGRVSNFSFNLNPDLSYNISIELTSKGSIIESLQANRSSKIYNIEVDKERFTDVTEIQSGKVIDCAGDNAISKYLFDLLTLQYPNQPGFATYNKGARVKGLQNVYESGLQITGGKDFIKIPETIKNNISKNRYGNNTYGFKGDANKEVREDLVFYEENNKEKKPRLPYNTPIDKDNRHYIRFKSLLDYINQSVIPSNKNGSAIEPVLSINSEEETNLVFLPEFNISFIPDICIHTLDSQIHNSIFIKGQSDLDKINEGGRGVSSLDTSGLFNPIGLNSTYMHEFRVKGFDFDGDRGGSIFKLMNLYLNFNMLNEAATKFSDIQGNISLFEFLKFILNKINYSFGNTLNLVPYINDDQQVVMLNQNPQFQILENNLPDFDLAGYRQSVEKTNNVITNRFSRGSIIRNFEFGSKISPAMASQMAIGASSQKSTSELADGTNFANMNIGVEDSYQQQFLDPPENDFSTDRNTADREALTTIWEEQKNKAKEIAGNFEVFASIITLKAGGIGGSITKALNIERFFQTFTDTETGFKLKNCNFEQWIELATAARVNKRLRDKQLQTAKTNQKTKKNDFKTAFANLIGGMPPLTNIVRNNSIINNVVDPVYGYEVGYFNSSQAEQCRKLFQSYIHGVSNKKFQTKGMPSSFTGFIPIEGSLTINGISGPTKLQTIYLDERFIPSTYPSSLSFQINGLSHTITNNDWETEIGILSTPNIKPKNTFKPLNEEETKELDRTNNIAVTSNPPNEESRDDSNENQEGTLNRIPVSQLEISDKGLEEIKRSEGIRLNAYNDPGSGGEPITIGYGQTMYYTDQEYTRNGLLKTSPSSNRSNPESKVKLGDSITINSATFGLRNLIDKKYGAAVKRLITVPLTQNEFDALVSFTYNVGSGGLKKSTTLKEINKKHYFAGGQAMALWNKADGKVLPGLVKRRADEIALFNENSPGDPA